MKFNRLAISSKEAQLDRILQNPGLLQSVIASWAAGERFEYTQVPRPWNPGGGSTLFQVRTASRKAFLKVKHLSVTVESRLEAEPEFSSTPSLRNEYAFLTRLSASSPSVPRPLGYFEESEHGFLFLEALETFAEAEPRLSACELATACNQIEDFVQLLYRQGIVHTDLHELNLLFRGKVPVVADFEEARDMRQDLPFEASLDVAGANRYGDVGCMPEAGGILPGYTCLNRLKEVFKRALFQKLPTLFKECNFDSSCPFLNALDHGRDERIYQSINIPGLQVQGQRQLDDNRIPQIMATIENNFNRPITHLDIGSNLGRFNLELSQNDLVSASYGVEAYDKYVELAKVQAFLTGNKKAHFLCAECGNDRISELIGGARIDCVTIYSVYHHIRNKAAFLEDIKALDPELILFEMPVQPECYEGRSWQQEMDLICQKLGTGKWETIGRTTDYDRPLVVVHNPRKAAAEKVFSLRIRQESSPVPNVSVVLPTYNQIKFLPLAIESVLQQTHTDFELIVVNDGSTDGTREFLAGLSDPRIVVINQENRKLPGALNSGFARARGEFLTWTSSDNYCAPIFLEALTGALEAHPEAGLAYSAFAWMDEKGNITAIQRDQNLNWYNLIGSNPGNASFMYRRECQDTLGLYDITLEGAEDWDMWLRLVERYPTVYVTETLYYFRTHPGSMTATKRERISAACQDTVTKAFERLKGQIELWKLFPWIDKCADGERAATLACLELGNTLLLSPFAPADLALPFLDAAYKRDSKPEYLWNLSLGYAKCGRWDQVEQCLAQLREAAPGGQTGDMTAYLEEQVKSRSFPNPPPLFRPQHQGEELFEREASERLVYSFTSPGDRTPSPPLPSP